MDSVCYLLDKEVANKKLKVRTDRELYADLGLRSEIIEMMMSYHPVWLRLGLETVYGEVIQMNKRAIQDAGRSILKHFVKMLPFQCRVYIKSKFQFKKCKIKLENCIKLSGPNCCI